MNESNHQIEYDRSLSLIENGAIEAAATVLEDLIKDNTQIHHVYHSWVELMLDNPDLANDRMELIKVLEASFDHMIIDSPKSAEAHLGRAFCLYFKANFDLSNLREQYIATSYGNSWFSLVKNFMFMRKKIEKLPEFKKIQSLFESSIDECNQVISKSPSLAHAYLVKARNYAALGDKDQSKNNMGYALKHGYHLKFRDKKYGVKNADPIAANQTKFNNRVSHLVEYMAYPIAILLVIPNLSSLEWTGSILALLGWSIAMWFAGLAFNLLAIGIIILAISLRSANKDMQLTEVLITRLKDIMVLSTITSFLSSALSFLMISQLFSSTNMYMSDLGQHILAAAIVGITVGSLKSTITIYRIYSTRDTKLKVISKK